jgi:hypothetical protein
VRKQEHVTGRQWAIFRSRMEELANAKADGIPSSVRDGYLAEVVLLLIDRLDDLEQRLSPSGSPTSPGLAALTQEDWDAFLSEYGEYVMDGWGDLRAFRTALGTLLATLEQREKQPKGGQKQA